MLNSKVYDAIKWVVITVIPALIVLLNTCLPLFGVPADVTSVIVTTLSAVGLFLGSVMGFSSVQYNKKINSEV